MKLLTKAHKWLNYKIQYADISIKIFTGYNRYNKITKRKGQDQNKSRSKSVSWILFQKLMQTQLCRQISLTSCSFV